jgi:predicted AlkP superfamily phosphohydrolase/phosphomutase
VARIRPEKAVLIGLDAAVIELVLQFADEGLMPNVAALLKRGVHTRLLSPYPTITPPNWATIATGAWPATHGIPSFEVYREGDPLDRTICGFRSGLNRAETIWTAAERAGKRTILMKYWGTWPPTIRAGVQVEGTAVSFFRGEETPILEHSLEHFFTTEPLIGRDQQVMRQIELVPAPDGSRQASLRFDLLNGRTFELWLELPVETDGQFQSVELRAAPDPAPVLGQAASGEWFPPFILDIPGDDRPGAFLIRVQRLEPDASLLELFAAPIYPTTGFTYPDDVAADLVTRFGPFSPKIQGRIEGAWVDDETHFQWYDRHNRWMGEATAYLMRTRAWDLVYLQNHCLDHINHLYLTRYDPATAAIRQRHAWFDLPTPETARHYLPLYYQNVDHMIGQILAATDEDTLVTIVSDHGANASTDELSMRTVLEELGYLVYADDEQQQLTDRPDDEWAPSARQIDWSRTRAYPTLRGHILLNVRGRQPQGVVEPGQGFERTLDDLITALHEYRDPHSGQSAFALVLRRQDAAIVGQGESAGDIIVAVRPELVGHEHGLNLPTARFGVGSAACLFIMAGPGIKKGVELTSLRWLVDVVPTIVHIMGFPVPRDCEGGIIYDALEDPDSLSCG